MEDVNIPSPDESSKVKQFIGAVVAKLCFKGLYFLRHTPMVHRGEKDTRLTLLHIQREKLSTLLCRYPRLQITP